MDEAVPDLARKAPEETPTWRSPRVRGLSARKLAWLFLTPALGLLAGLQILPLLAALALSFTDYRANRPGMPVRLTGPDNYVSILGSPDVWAAMQASARFMGLAVGVQMLLGLGLALLLERQFRGHRQWALAICLPVLLSPAVAANVARLFVAPNGPLSPVLAMLMVETWIGTPQVMLICLAGLAAIPGHLRDAAELDRASAWQRFRHVSLPLLTPFLLLAAALRALASFGVHELAVPLSSGAAYATLALRIEAFDRWRTGYGSAFAIIICVSLIGLAGYCTRALNNLRQP